MADDKRVAVITGVSASGSAAFAVAEAFARDGWDICITGRHMKKVSQAAKQLAAQASGDVVPLVFEATREHGAQDAAWLAQKVHEQLGAASALVNASQAAKVGDLLQSTKAADFFTAVDSGLMAAYMLMQAFYPQLKATGGTVVNFASDCAAQGQQGMSLLAASKEGLRGMSRVAAAEWADDGIRVACVEPRVRTSAFAKWAAEYPDAAAAFDNLEDAHGFAARVVALAS